MIITRYGAAALLFMAACQPLEYGPETIETASDRLPPLVPAFATTEEFTNGYAALSAGNFAAAEPLLARSLEVEPNDPYALLAMGAVMERTGRHYQATTYYHSAIQYGEASPAGNTEQLDDITAPGASGTVADLARTNVARLESR